MTYIVKGMLKKRFGEKLERARLNIYKGFLEVLETFTKHLSLI